MLFCLDFFDYYGEKYSLTRCSKESPISINNVLSQQILMHVDDFSHEHLAVNVWMEAINRKAGI